jgi:hypothetical protein
MRAALAPLLALVLLAPAACSSGGETQSDGKVHPEGDGVRQSEADACAALSAGIDAAFAKLGCVATSQLCPSLIQVTASGATCLQYDRGSVQGCVAYFGEQTSCEALTAALGNCVPASFAGSAPAGCP